MPEFVDWVAFYRYRDSKREQERATTKAKADVKRQVQQHTSRRRDGHSPALGGKRARR
jgi:hypothetical protein